MSDPVEVRLPVLPECWESCGACADGALLVSDILVNPGDRVRCDDPIVSLETDKTTLEIPAPRADRVSALHVEPGDEVTAGTLLLTLQAE
ncbi:lipoyl domain-containing protein [Sedimenticola hydrogenitrophicus]|uniref:lipoyl domain-containing protein n=1 Tax=Sedimenticola hydrogenitrophicus TaxID=2967975 RepID=UPI0021A3597C|nr:lipoyl domain-containing protein [Sedimenticola hydrogenitrophicus]